MVTDFSLPWHIGTNGIVYLVPGQLLENMCYPRILHLSEGLATLGWVVGRHELNQKLVSIGLMGRERRGYINYDSRGEACCLTREMIVWCRPTGHVRPVIRESHFQRQYQCGNAESKCSFAANMIRVTLSGWLESGKCCFQCIDRIWSQSKLRTDNCFEPFSEAVWV